MTISIEKYLTSSQPDPINEEVDRLRYRVFATNSPEDTRALLVFLLGAWSEGSLVSRDLAEKYSVTPQPEV